MKKLCLVLMLSVIFFQLATAQSNNYRIGEYIQVVKTDSIKTQFMAAGQTVDIFGWLGNDLFSAAELISIDGYITDDAILASRHASIRGTIGDLLAGVAETFIIDGNVNGDIFVAGREVRITNNTHIIGNAHIAAETIIIEGGLVEGQLNAAASTIRIDGRINNKAHFYTPDITFGENYQATYGTNIISDQEVHRENIGIIPPNLTITINKPKIWPVLLFKIGLYLALLITGLIFIRLFEQTSKDLYRFSTEQMLKNTGTGLLSFIAWPIVITALFILVLTIPLSIILLFMYGLALLFSYLFVAMLLGSMGIVYFKQEATTSTYYWGLALGMILVGILVNLPFIGWVLNILLLFFGLGSIVRYVWINRTVTESIENPQGAM
ncbi:polymer-forming cytoskeletal protein [Fodinibius saliphilus]|uniref:polymer-forming cytoskeletal protein n=1 Tax=Fodinibius saliphilus TaxID=1920650 RepID=UPI001487605F|nr:polymer-forming cytoskeletal protein [Fodinibius saliphilus]